MDEVAVTLAKVHVFIGGLLGAILVFLFGALAIRAVGRTAYYVIHEVRRQFEESPGIMRGELKPDYARCVDIVTAGALKEMIAPGLLAVTMPVAVGLVLHAEAVAAPLMVGTITGILLTTVMNNGGGAWDNAKKYIESGVYGGKGSETHKAAVVRGHRWGSVQRYGWTVAPRADQIAQYHHSGHGAVICLRSGANTTSPGWRLRGSYMVLS
jgi:K(+)-stimulated pyrophosphate-energized sodium pump